MGLFMDSLGVIKICKHVGVGSLKNVEVLINAKENNYSFLAARNTSANVAFAC